MILQTEERRERDKERRRNGYRNGKWRWR